MPSSSPFAVDPVRKPSMPGSYPEDHLLRHTPSQANLRSRDSRSAAHLAPLQHAADDLGDSPPSSFALPTRPSVPPPGHDRNWRGQADHRQRRYADVGSSDIPAHSPRSTSAYSQSPEKTAHLPDQKEDDDFEVQVTPPRRGDYDARSADRASGSAKRGGAFGSHGKKASTHQDDERDFHELELARPSSTPRLTTYGRRKKRRPDEDEDHDDIQSPDGPWSGDEGAQLVKGRGVAAEIVSVGSDDDGEIEAGSATSKSGKGPQHTQLSPIKLRRPMKTKDGKTVNRRGLHLGAQLINSRNCQYLALHVMPLTTTRLFQAQIYGNDTGPLRSSMRDTAMLPQR